MNSPSAVLLYTGTWLEAEAVMKNAMLVLVALATSTLLFGSVPAQAIYDCPWCGVYGVGEGSVAEKCDYRDFESCRTDIISGNRGFCRQNGYWRGNTDPTSPRHRKARKHAQP
jgi:hypothetical protein